MWFVYDGECPLCNSAAHAFRIKQEYGSIYLIDARTCAENPLIYRINELGLDLDEGMIIYARGRFYHGKGALKFMAHYGDSRNAFTALKAIPEQCLIFTRLPVKKIETSPTLDALKNGFLSITRKNRAGSAPT